MNGEAGVLGTWKGLDMNGHCAEWYSVTGVWRNRKLP